MLNITEQGSSKVVMGCSVAASPIVLARPNPRRRRFQNAGTVCEAVTQVGETFLTFS